MTSSRLGVRAKTCGLVAVVCLIAGCASASAGEGRRGATPSSAEASSGGSGPTPTPSASASQIDRAVAAVEETVATTHPQVGVQVVLRIGSQVRTVVRGAADRATARPVTTDDRLAVASITKSLVATAVMEYVADGTVGLDDPAARWVPRLKSTKPITVRQLLAHRSGLHSDDSWWDGKNTEQDVVRLSVQHGLDFPPGSDGAYSNLNYVVLGLLLEEVSGKSLGEVLKVKVFRPAGMTSTTLGGRPTVLGYEGGAVVDPGLNGPFDAAGGVVSTAADIDRFYRHLFAGDLVPRRLVRTMSTPTGTVPLGVGEYGLGLWTWSMRCADGIGHSGSLHGFSSKAWTMPDKGRSIVVLVNESDGDDHLTAAIADNALCA